jgi:uncharacterized membrane protein
MIQRVQTIFLALVAILMFASAFLGLWSKTQADTQQEVTLTAFELVLSEKGEVKSRTTTVYLALLAFVASAVAVGSIFSYTSRPRQIMLNFFNTLIIAGMMFLTIKFLFDGEKMLEPTRQGSFGPGFFLPFAALIFNSLANRFIRADEKLVKSVDRLR